ncbi:MAG: ShlB/FhaC/HecB family hemolysin secretion/activation protein [Alphaproteobacteria bacterium]|nr:ShlB/FhaC/HecB family hemolysin secretion/activation protein [Alphaproteobacteria bacterium]
MLMNSKKLFWQALVCSTFISTSALIMSSNAYAETTSEEKVSNVNQQLLTPNETVDDMTDINRARRYYQTRESRSNAQTEETDDTSVDTTEDEIKLPARTNEYAPSVHIYRVDISDSEVFSFAEINKFRSLVEKKDVTIEDINNLVKLINSQYLKKGFITARAFITEGKLEGVLKIELMEAHIGKLAIDGNKYNREWYLRSQFSHKDGELFSLQDLQNDLKTFNKNARSIKMRAQLKPGEEYGTTDITLKAEETMPYHLSASFDNFGRDTTGEHRGGIVASTDSLIGFQDRLSVAFNAARSSFNPYIDYNVPVNRYGTRAGVSYMFGKSKVTNGEYKDFDLNAKTNTYSGYISHPLIDTVKWKLNVNTSLNYKTSKAKISGFKYSDYKDTNVAIGLGGNYNFEKSVFYGSLYSTNGVIKDKIRHESEHFTKFNADAYYIHYLPWGIIGTLKAGGQYSPDNIAYVEQYQIGGISSVRGYSESLLMAPSAYYTSLEMLFPIPFLPETIDVPFSSSGNTFRLRDSVKFAAFLDHGGIFYHEGKPHRENFLLSDGIGLRIAINKYLSARFYVGFPLMNRGTYHESDTSFHFDLIAVPF